MHEKSNRRQHESVTTARNWTTGGTCTNGHSAARRGIWLQIKLFLTQLLLGRRTGD